jgi:tetratricopeptide (TPR) repeat protein
MRSGLAHESRDTVRIKGERVGQHLNRDVPAEIRVVRSIDFAHLQLRQALALAVAPLELEGRILLVERRADEGIALLRKALDREKAIGYSEPPLYPHPIEEVLGRALVDLGRWADAEAMFNAALSRDPGSGRALYGLSKAQEGAGARDQARFTFVQFRAAWAHADADLPEMQAR